MKTVTYDTIGRGYAEVRRPDPRIAKMIRDAVGDARTVVNVGAGTGSYEPGDLEVVAVEPSAAMIAQRPHGSARVVRAYAENLPFQDKSFDVALAILTLHHWTDWRRGLAEMRRVAAKTVVLTHDPRIGAEFWIMEYFPQFARDDAVRFCSMDQLIAVLDPCTVLEVPIPADCRDGFLGAYWRRPEAYLDPAVRRGISSFGVAQDQDALQRGLTRLASDVESGQWHRRWGHLATLPALDIGYRLVATS